MVTVSPLDRTVALKQRRLALDLSREALAAIAGLSPRTIYAIEVEGVRPQRATRRVLADALECEPTDLFPLSTSEAAGGNRGSAKLADGGDGRNGP